MYTRVLVCSGGSAAPVSPLPTPPPRTPGPRACTRTVLNSICRRDWQTSNRQCRPNNPLTRRRREPS